MNKTNEDHNIIRDLGFSLLAEGTILKIKADGYSMYPSIKPGTTIFIEPLKEDENIVPEQIIAWKRESGFVVHRLIRTENRVDQVLYYTRGDSCKYEDKPVTADQIAGKVIRVEDRKHRIREENSLIEKPCYSANRIIVWSLLKIKRIYRFFISRYAGSITILMLIAIPLFSFMIPFVFLVCGNNSFYFNHKGAQRLSQSKSKYCMDQPYINVSEESGLYEPEI